MLNLWVRVLEKLPATELAFPQFDGTRMVHLERKVDHAARALGHSLPTSTTFRKQLEINNKRIEGPKREAVSRALSHSISTAAQYYQAPTHGDSLSTYRTIQELIATKKTERGKGGVSREGGPSPDTRERRGRSEPRGTGAQPGHKRERRGRSEPTRTREPGP